MAMHTLSLCIVTASTPQQAALFTTLIRDRQKNGLYPREIDFRVYSDPEKGRVGSGGGTFLALTQVCADYGVIDPLSFFEDTRILIIHAGGESRRLPCYVPEGKLFAPLPMPSSSLFPPVVLDAQLALFLKFPFRKGEVVVSSGDVVIDFDVSCVPINRGDVCGFAKPATYVQGSRHGVFAFDTARKKVVDFYQKATPHFLAKHAAIEGLSECALDMGIIALSPAAAVAYCTLSYAHESKNSLRNDIEQGSLNFDIYLEVLTACLAHITEEEYIKRIAPSSKLSKSAQQSIYKSFHQFTLNGIVTRSTSFLHFGALAELYESGNSLQHKDIKPFYVTGNSEVLPASAPHVLLYGCRNTIVSNNPAAPIVAEGCDGFTCISALGNNVFVGVTELEITTPIPLGICLDERVVTGKKIRLVYSMQDTFKKQDSVALVMFCGIPLTAWCNDRGIELTHVYPHGQESDLYEAELFAPELSDALLTGYWAIPLDKESWKQAFCKAVRHSLASLNALDSAQAREERRKKIRAHIIADQMCEGKGFTHICASDFGAVAVAYPRMLDAAVKLRTGTDDPLLKEYRHALLDALSATSVRGEAPTGFSIDYVSQEVRKFPAVSIKEDQIVWARSPVRLDIAGGWSDTPPYTLRFGGQVVNVAVNLNGQPPIQVFCRRTTEYHIRIHSIDIGVSETITQSEKLLDYTDPTSPFGLPKAALALLFGQVLATGVSLESVLRQCGSGIEITLLCAVPKGSGLGTSSILGATILGALHRFFGMSGTLDDLFLEVLQMEQMLTTGGGWQDQIGGVVGGVKFIKSQEGLRPSPIIHQCDSFLFDAPEMASRFTLFYTGITRLAKNILQEVVHNVNCSTPAYLYTINQTRELAKAAWDAMALRSQDALANILCRSWEANCRIHASTSNPQIDAMLKALRPWYQGVKLLGAGGGGYVLFLSKTTDDASELRKLLVQNYENSKARIVEFNLNKKGLEVTVS